MIVIKGHIHVSHIFFYIILPKHAKNREPKDEHRLLQCTFIYATVDPKTTLKIYSHTQHCHT